MAELFIGLATNIPFLICFLLGVLCVLIEIFTPGFGVPGILGIVLLFVSILFVQATLFAKLVLVLLILLLLCVLIAVGIRSASHGRLWRSPLILHTSLTKDAGFSGTEDMEYFLGRTGIARTALRPAGTAEFDGVRVDVVSESDFIEAGTPIRVVQVAGRRIVVQPDVAPTV